jgi:outer membrane protein TolC
MKIHLYKAVLIIFFLPFISLGQNPEDLSLQQAVTIALEKNFDIQIAKKELESAQINNSWEAAGIFPSVSLGVNQSNGFDESQSMVLPDLRNKITQASVQPNVQLQWLLFNGLSVYINKARLDLLEDLSEGNVALLVENNIQAVVLAYYQVLKDRERLLTIEKVKKLSKDRFDYEQTRKEFGAAVSYDVLQAKNAYLSDSTNYLLQSLQLKQSLLNLNLLMGVDKESVYHLTTPFQAISEDYLYGDLEEKMFSNNKTLLNQYINQEILMKSTNLAKANIWPTLNMSAGGNFSNSYIHFEGNDPIYPFNYSFFVNFSLNFNLYSGGQTRRAIQQARISEEIGQIQQDQIKQTLSNGLLSVYEMYDIRKQLLNVADVSLETAQLNLDLSTERFKNGSINSFNFRDVQIQFINAEFNRLEAVYNLIDTHTELLRATGGIISEFE